MRAVAIDAFGETPVVHELPMPEPGPGELLVHVQASSVNGFDLAVASGMIKDLMPHAFRWCWDETSLVSLRRSGQTYHTSA